MIRPEPYTDGWTRSRLFIEITLNAPMAAAILASEEISLGYEISGLTKAEAEKRIRAALRRSGTEHYFYVHEGMDKDKWAEVYGRAREAIERWWPTWNFDPPSP